MKFVLQLLTIRIINDAKLRMGGSAEKRKRNVAEYYTRDHTISNCGKTKLIREPERFENVYVSKSLQQPKYQYLENLFTFIDEIGFTFSNNSNIVPPSETCKILFLSLMTWHVTSRIQ